MNRIANTIKQNHRDIFFGDIIHFNLKLALLIGTDPMEINPITIWLDYVLADEGQVLVVVERSAGRHGLKVVEMGS